MLRVRGLSKSFDGREIFSEPREQADGGEFRLGSEVQPGGLLWYQRNDRYGLMRVQDDRVEFLTEAVAKHIIPMMLQPFPQM